MTCGFSLETKTNKHASRFPVGIIFCQALTTFRPAPSRPW